MPSRRVQLISTKSKRKAVLQWMIAKFEEDGTDKRITAHAVGQFPNMFKQNNSRENREKARQWWKTRNKPLSITSSRQWGSAVRRSSVKALLVEV